jgi:hypothetical protein
LSGIRRIAVIIRYALENKRSCFKDCHNF